MKQIPFADLVPSPDLRRAIAEMGFEEPTPIQTLAIPAIRAGKDVIGQAHTGTGKTAAFGIPLLERIDPRDRHVRALVLCPTRELAIQVAEELARLSSYRKGVSILPVYGGQPMDRQLAALGKGVQVVIATPGRLLDHLRRGSMTLSGVRMVVLDEGDVMLDMGFIDDIEAILDRTPRDRQTVLFSATVPDEVKDLARRYLRDPEMIRVVHGQLTVPGIEQRYYEVQDQEKLEFLARLLDEYTPSLALVFCNTKRRTEGLARRLRARGYRAERLHGDMTQNQRERVMRGFRAGGVEILVATDVAARGIDVEGIDAVFNYDVPQDPEYYVHRIGRTARAGRAGRAFTLVSRQEQPRLREIQRYARISLDADTVPPAGRAAAPGPAVPTAREPLPPAAAPAPAAVSPPAGPPAPLRAAIEGGRLDRERETVRQWAAAGYPPEDIAAALLSLSGGREPGNSGDQPRSRGKRRRR